MDGDLSLHGHLKSLLISKHPVSGQRVKSAGLCAQGRFHSWGKGPLCLRPLLSSRLFSFSPFSLSFSPSSLLISPFPFTFSLCIITSLTGLQSPGCVTAAGTQADIYLHAATATLFFAPSCEGGGSAPRSGAVCKDLSLPFFAFFDRIHLQIPA